MVNLLVLNKNRKPLGIYFTINMQIFRDCPGGCQGNMGLATRCAPFPSHSFFSRHSPAGKAEILNFAMITLIRCYFSPTFGRLEWCQKTGSCSLSSQKGQSASVKLSAMACLEGSLQRKLNHQRLGICKIVNWILCCFPAGLKKSSIFSHLTDNALNMYTGDNNNAIYSGRTVEELFWLLFRKSHTCFHSLHKVWNHICKNIMSV